MQVSWAALTPWAMLQTLLLTVLLDMESPAQGLHRVPLPDCYQLHVLAPTAGAPAVYSADWSAACCITLQMPHLQHAPQNAKHHLEFDIEST